MGASCLALAKCIYYNGNYLSFYRNGRACCYNCSHERTEILFRHYVGDLTEVDQHKTKRTRE